MRQLECTTYFISNYEVDMMYSIGLTGPSLGRVVTWVIPFISNVWVSELSNAEEHSVLVQPQREQLVKYVCPPWTQPAHH